MCVCHVPNRPGASWKDSNKRRVKLSGSSLNERVAAIRLLGRRAGPAPRDPVLASNNWPEIRQFIARMGAASCRRRNIVSSRTSAYIGQRLRGAIGRSASSYRWPRLGLKQPFSRIVANSGKPRQANHNRVLAIPPRRDPAYDHRAGRTTD